MVKHCPVMKIVPRLAALALFILINSSCFLISSSQNETYLIPKDYTGDVIIIFNQPDGAELEIESGTYVYKIPADGILKVRNAGKSGMVNRSYFYVNENNQRQEIKNLRITGERNPAGQPQNKFGNISQSEYESSVFVMNASGLGSFNTKNGVVQYTSFIVGTPKESERLYDQMEKRISELQRKLTN
jgi:hypothetical protein